MGIGETLRRALDKLVMRAADDQTKTACGNLQLCAGLEAGIEGATHAVGQQRLERLRSRRVETEDEAATEAEKEEEGSGDDQLFAALRRSVPKAQPREARRNAWISEKTWRLIKERVSALQDPQYGQMFTHHVGKEVKKSLAEDRKRRADKAGVEVEALVKADPSLIQEA